MFEFLSILLVGIAGGLIPLFFKWGDRQHHIALAFSTGIFLGAVFLHLLPSVAAAGAAGGGHDHALVSAPSVGFGASMGDHAAEFAERAAELAAAGQTDDAHAGHDHAGHDHAGHDLSLIHI